MFYATRAIKVPDEGWTCYDGGLPYRPSSRRSPGEVDREWLLGVMMGFAAELRDNDVLDRSEKVMYDIERRFHQ